MPKDLAIDTYWTDSNTLASPAVSESWAAGILDKLAERDDVVDVYATTEELEEAIPTP